MKLTTLTPVLLALTSGITALEIKFIRYSRRGCTSDAYHIAADTNLENPYCKTFDSDEPAFYSFKIEHEDDGDDLKENYCQATVYDQAGCTGKAFTRGDMKTYIGQCADSTIPGRSVRISCEPRISSTITKSMPSTASTTTITVTSATMTDEQGNIINAKGDVAVGKGDVKGTGKVAMTTVTLIPSWNRAEEWGSGKAWWE